MIMKKKFQYDVLLSRENICNLKRESARILQGIEKGEKMVVYGRRNMGKTSLIKSVVIPEYRKRHPGSFVLFADLMQVKGMRSLGNRLRLAFEESFKDSFPKKFFLENIKKYLKGVKPLVSVDPISGETGLTLTSEKGVGLTVSEIFRLLQKNFLNKIDGLIVLDEFQDISFVDEAEGIFRNALQELGSTPVVLMGSKKHILSKMFSSPSAPFADFGADIEFGEISYQEYHDYILERFAPFKLTIDFENSKYWQDLLFRNPEPINILGSYLVDQYYDHKIDQQKITQALLSVIRQRRARFDGVLGGLTANEEEVLVAMAKSKIVRYPAGKEFLSKVLLSNATVTKIVDRLCDRSIVDKTSDGFKVASPFLYYYLNWFR